MSEIKPEFLNGKTLLPDVTAGVFAFLSLPPPEQKQTAFAVKRFFINEAFIKIPEFMHKCGYITDCGD